MYYGQHPSKHGGWWKWSILAPVPPAVQWELRVHYNYRGPNEPDWQIEQMLLVVNDEWTTLQDANVHIRELLPVLDSRLRMRPILGPPAA